jgi:hypothetical protein
MGVGVAAGAGVGEAVGTGAGVGVLAGEPVVTVKVAYPREPSFESIAVTR